MSEFGVSDDDLADLFTRADRQQWSNGRLSEELRRLSISPREIQYLMANRGR